MWSGVAGGAGTPTLHDCVPHRRRYNPSAPDRWWPDPVGASSSPAVGSCSRQAGVCPPPSGSGSGSTRSHGAKRSGRRGWNRQPDGGRDASGVSPPSTIGAVRRVGSVPGRRQHVGAGVRGGPQDRSGRTGLDDAAHVHDRQPRAVAATVDRSWVIMRTAMPCARASPAIGPRRRRGASRDAAVAGEPVGPAGIEPATKGL